MTVCGFVCVTMAAGLSLLAQEKKFEIGQLAFMSGCWAGQSEETWMKPAGGSMLGLSRTVAKGKTVFTEYMQIVEQDGVVTMHVQLKLAARATPFKLVEIGEKGAIFSNPEHDFPQRIIYRKEPDGSLFARIEGIDKGKERHADFPMKRAKCD